MSSKSNNVIPLSMTADFFAERANRSLDRYHYNKALRYFKRAGEIEPHNPLHFCNIAGVLGHMGKFDESNEVLNHVLQTIDGNTVECHYYLACNYVYMDLLEKAEEHALIYLRKEPKGRYVKDAVELLEYVADELDRPSVTKDLDLLEEDEKTALHEKARILMEEGSFQQAEKVLLQLIQEYPDFLAACNNLSLCYYYKGEIEKSRDMIAHVLKQDPCNIHALCNLAILYYQQQELDNLQDLLTDLRKIVPLQFDQAYKLGITLGVMGEHLAAYKLFKKMAEYAWHLDFHLHHYCAVSAYNIGRYKEAAKYWKLVQREDPESPVAPYYLELIAKKVKTQDIPYYYQVPNYYQKPKQKAQDPFIRSSFLWALRHGDRETKMQVLQAFEWLGDQEVIEALQEFVANPDQEQDLVKIAQFVLNTLSHTPSGAPIRWRQSWKEVLQELSEIADEGQKNKASELWTQFIYAAYPKVPVIRKPQAWAAAVKYIVWNRDEQVLTELANTCGVTIKTIKKHALFIQEVIQQP